uniref:Uncharacterized protein n=1 Tax=Panagrolaimus sp. PS1159 TaxID=55785 RepID=A0AC35GWI7_9BILA
MSKLVCIVLLLITVELTNAQQYYSNPSSAYLMGYPYGSYSNGGGYGRYPSYSNTNMMYSNGMYQQQQYNPYGSYYNGYGRSSYQYPSSYMASSYQQPSYAYAARSYQPSSPLASVSLFCANCSRGKR